MRINELLAEQEQLDELSLKGLGQGIGKAVGAAAGGIVQGAKNVWSGAKQGYAAGQAALAPGADPAADPAAAGSTAPATGSGGAVATPPAGQAPAATPPAGGEAPASPAVDQASKVGVGQINKIIPTLRTRDLNSVKKTVDDTLVKKQKQPAAAPAKPGAAAPAKPGAVAPAAPTQAELDADRERLMGPDNGGANESKIVRFESRFLGTMI